MKKSPVESKHVQILPNKEWGCLSDRAILEKVNVCDSHFILLSNLFIMSTFSLLFRHGLSVYPD